MTMLELMLHYLNARPNVVLDLPMLDLPMYYHNAALTLHYHSARVITVQVYNTRPSPALTIY